MAAPSTGMASILASMRMPAGVNPVEVMLPPPPKLEGALTPNNVLSKAVRFADNMVLGPESMVVVNGYVYTGYANGWVAEVNPRGGVRGIRRMSMPACGTRFSREDSCGRPLGVRARNGYLYVADAYNGILKINPVNRTYEHFVNTREVTVNGKPLGFINDLVVAKDGTVFFTSSSTKYTRQQYLDIILEGETSGRVLVYNPGTNKTQELVTNLNFANGVELSADDSYLLIAEGARARIFKAYIGPNTGDKRGTIEPFIENLPGFVDNIRRTKRGTYWVGLSSVRYDGRPSVLDTYGKDKVMRGYIMGMNRAEVLRQAPKYAMAVEIDGNGNIIRSIHDQEGKTFTSVSEIEEEGDLIYIGSFDRRYIGILKKSDLPPVKLPQDPATGGDTLDQQLAKFLDQFNTRITPWNKQQLQALVLRLVENLIRAKLEASKLLEQIESLRQQIGQGGATSTTASMPRDDTTSSSSSDTTPSSTSSDTTPPNTTPTSPSGSVTTPSGTTSGDSTTSSTSSSDTTSSGSGSTGGVTSSTAGDTTTEATSTGSTDSSTDSGSTGADSSTDGGSTDAGTTATPSGSTDSTDSSASSTQASDSSTDSTTSVS